MGRPAHVPLDTSSSMATVTSLLRWHLEHNPTSTFAIFPGVDDDVEPVRVSFRHYANAVIRFAQALRSNEHSGRTGVIGLLIHCDTILYSTALAGVIAAGYTVFPISPRNSPAAVVHLLREVSAIRLLVSSDHLAALIGDVRNLLDKDSYPLEIQELPRLSDIYPRLVDQQVHEEDDPLDFPHFAFSGNVEMYLHSSGSTGFPKPIPYSNAVMASHARFTWVAEVIERSHHCTLGGLGVPTFHAMGMLFHLLYPLLTGYPTAMYRPRFPSPPVVTAPDVALTSLRSVGADIVFVVPAFLETWVHDASAMNYLKSVEVLAFAGGPLATSAGRRLLEAGCNVTSVYGGTEFGPVSRLFLSIPRPKESDSLAWCEFGPHIRTRWKDEGDGTFELELLSSETHVLAKEDLPDVRGYATRDLWVPHPSIKGLWRIVGRSDDVIILSTGEKIVPSSMEYGVLSHPDVKAVVMFGRGRKQGGLLIEARKVDPGLSFDDLREAIWPVVQAANQNLPAFAHVHKDMMVFVDSSRPLPLTPKGTVLRKAALVLYEADIEHLYDDLENGRTRRPITGPHSWSEDDVRSWIMDIVSKASGARVIDPSTSLFDQGFDSLSTIMLRNQIIGAIRESEARAKEDAIRVISANITYATASPDHLARALTELVQTGHSSLGVTTEADIMEMVDKYSSNIPKQLVKESKKTRSGLVVAITGTTGGLGSHLLAQLLKDPSIERIYALNRPSLAITAQEKQRRSFESRFLDVEALSSSKVEFIEYRSGVLRLGLDQETYDKLRTSVTTIIHNAWQLDFTLPLFAFEPHLAATRDLLDLAECSVRNARFILISSVSTARTWPGLESVPEANLDHPSVCLGFGYAESKFVAEQMVKRRRLAGLEAVTLRVGQIAGSQTHGTWSTQDWVPIIIKSGVALGSLPATDGVVSWVPVDVVVQLCMNVASDDAVPSPVLNVVHPRPVAWNMVMDLISGALVEEGVVNERLPLLPCSKWLQQLNDAASIVEEEHLRAMPALKLSDFLDRLASSTSAEADGLPLFNTTFAQSASSTLCSVQPIGSREVGLWIWYWNTQGWL